MVHWIIRGSSCAFSRVHWIIKGSSWVLSRVHRINESYSWSHKSHINKTFRLQPVSQGLRTCSKGLCGKMYNELSQAALTASARSVM